MPQNLGVNHPLQTPSTTSTLSSSAGPVNISFSFINDADVLVFLGGTLRTNGTGTDNYTINTAKTQVTFNNTVSGDVIITRKSDLLNKVRTFTPGSSIRAADLNTQFDQVMQLIQDNYEVLRGIVQNDSNDEITPGRTILIKDDAVVTNSIVDGAVTTAKIANGTIINEDINANAQIDVNKLADGTSRQLLQTAANGNDVEWTSNVDVPGTLDVTGVATFDGNIDANGDLDVDGTTNLDNVDIDGTVHVQGTSTFVGQITASGGVSGDVTGNLTGNASTATDLAAATKIAANEQVSHTPDDSTYYTTSAADNRFWRQDAAGNEVIQTSATWTANDSRVATTGAIDARIVNLVTEVGGFVPIANETSFPTTNPDINDGAGTIVSVGNLASNLTFNGSGVATIANGAGTGNTVTISGGPASTTIQASNGVLVETTTTLHTYTWHRTIADSTDVSTVANSIANVNTVAGSIANVNTVAGDIANVNTVAGNIANVNTVAGISANVTTVAGISANVTTVAGISADVTTVAGQDTEIGRLGTADAVADMNTLATTAIVSDMDTLADISTDISTVAGISANVTTVANNDANITTVANDLNEGTSEIDTVATNITNVNNVGNNIANVNTVANNMAGVNDFAARYRAPQTTANEYTSNNDTGDLYFNTSSNELRVWNGSSWQAGVTAGTGFASTSGATFTGPILLDNNDDVGTPDLSFDGDTNTGIYSDAADHISFSAGGSKVFEIGANGVEVGTWNGSTIATDKGGTGQTTYSSGQLLIGNSSGGLTKATLTGTAPVTITNGNGSITIDVSDATTSADGLMSSSDKTKLDGIATGAEVNVATNLGVTTTTTTNVVTSSTGTNATIGEATGSAAGLMSTTHHDKLDGIATGAEVNVATNLGQTTGASSLTITSSTGNNVTVAEASSSIAGLMSTAHHDKLDGIEASADVTDATNVAAAGAVMESDTTTANMSFVIDEDAMGSNSATKVPTQQSVKAYVDNQVGGISSSAITNGTSNVTVTSNAQTTITANSVEAAEFGTTEVVFNDTGADRNFRVESDDNANMLFVDGGEDRVGIGTATPSCELEISGTGAIEIPQGTTAQRPGTPANGMIRINSTSHKPEWYSSEMSSWLDLDRSGIASVDWLVVAGGGAGGGYDNAYRYGNNGSDSVFHTNTATGGGGGDVSTGSAGRDGGSGGGAHYNSSGGSGVSGQGHDGGDAAAAVYANGGGGGAGAVGANSSGASDPGDGGIGKQSNITGTMTYYAGGGGGGTNSSGVTSSGGQGGGGGAGNNVAGIDGTANTGGGGGGSSFGGGGGAGGYLEGTGFVPVSGTAYTVTVGAGGAAIFSTYGPYCSGAGGSGVVIFSYPSGMTATYSSGVTKTTTTNGGNTVDKITATSSTSETVTWTI